MAKLMILLVLLALVGAQAGESDGSPNKKAKTPGNKKADQEGNMSPEEADDLERAHDESRSMERMRIIPLHFECTLTETYWNLWNP